MKPFSTSIVTMRHTRFSRGLKALLLLSTCSWAASLEAQSNSPRSGQPPSSADTPAVASFQDASFTPDQLEYFEKQVRPLLAKRCYECHSVDSKPIQGGLRLDSRAATLKGGDTGPAIVPGNVADSLMIDAIRYGEIYQMPPKSRMPADEVRVLERWVAMGAPWPVEAEPTADAAAEETFDLQARRQSHWAWQPVEVQEPPILLDESWSRTPIDRWVGTKLIERGLPHAPRADRATLIRRIAFDLTGLPPTLDELERFADEREVPLPQVVDWYLASPHFGERWARHWMDLVRYAETFGHEFDYPIHHAWQYRDYLVRAFNEDVPYDQLVLEHLAGDLLPHPRRHPETRMNESILGTGFWYLGEATHAPVDVRGDEAGRIDNQIDVMTKTFLAMTVACARCHDHKFDAISTQDYYALAGFLQSTHRQLAPLDPGQEIQPIVDQWLSQRSRLNEQTLQALPLASPAQQAWLADRLRATALVHQGAEPAVAARKYTIPATELAKWTEATKPDTTREADHPLNLWNRLRDLNNQAELRTRLSESASEFAQAKRRADELDTTLPTLFDFRAAEAPRWFPSGWAFDGPHDQPRLKLWNDTIRLEPAGVLSSGAIHRKLHGVVRSPTFTIDAPNLYYRIAGENVTVRLIIDGYTMIEFHQLLFRDVQFNLNTKGKWIWRRQSGDLNKYIGHRAHLEIHDLGDGWVALEQIRATADPVQFPQENAVALAVVEAAKKQDPTDVHGAFGDYWNALLTRWHDQRLTPADVEFFNWLAAEQLLTSMPGIDKLLPIWTPEQTKNREWERELPAPTYVIACRDGSAENERVHIRGSHRVLGDVVPRRPLEAILPEGWDLSEQPGSGRLEFAQSLIDPKHPLTARVMANRIWHHLMGRGIVPTVDNFGVLGQRPSHPELLNFLAHDLIQRKWSIKSLIKSIMLSEVYQMSSAPMPDVDAQDPTNQWWHRREIRRLEGEAIRDAMLTLSGSIDKKLLGPSVPVHITPFMQGRGRPGKSGPLDGNGRRSLYIEVRRNFLSPMMLAFDTPIPFNTMGRRNISNVPAQALILMNDPFVMDQARRWAERLVKMPQTGFESRVQFVYRQAFARLPRESEIRAARQFFDQRQAIPTSVNGQPSLMPDDVQLWADYCHVLFNVKEFIYLP